MKAGGTVRISLLRGCLIWGPVALYLAAISVLSHQSRLVVPGAVPDWLAHGLEFGGLAALAARGVRRSGIRLSPRAGAAIVIACAGVGALDEFHQSFVPGRESSLRDVLADTVGAGIVVGGLLAAGLVARAVRARAGRGDMVDVALLGRRGCHLCDEAEAVITQVLPGFRARLRKMDVDQDPDLKRRYGEQVPVVLVDGRKIFKYRVDAARLRRTLASCEQRRAS